MAKSRKNTNRKQKATKSVKLSNTNNKTVQKIQRMTYFPENLLSAVEEARAGVKIANCSRKYKVPESTIRSRLKNASSNKKPGPNPELSAQEENDLVAWILWRYSAGLTVTKNHLLDSVKIICDNDGRTTKFIDNRPGKTWYKAFMNRHPKLAERTPENVSLARANLSETRIRDWFEEVSSFFEEENITSITSDRIFNTDETLLQLNPKPVSKLALEGAKNVRNITEDNEKENVSVLITGSAAGVLVPPFILFKGKRLPKNVVGYGPREYGYGFAEHGYMTSECFYKFMVNIFQPWLLKNNIKFPVVMYLDGHNSLITFPLAKFCKEQQIILIELIPNATHVIQPMDVAFFKALKVAWSKAYQEFCKKNATIHLEHRQFSVALESALQSLTIPSILRNGFRRCGLFPLDANAVNYSKIFEKSKPQGNEMQEILENNIADPDQEKLLLILEKTMGSEIVTSFKQNRDDTWQGNVEDTSLFKVWKKLSNDLGINL